MTEFPRSDGYYAAQEAWLQGDLSDEDFRSVSEQQFGTTPTTGQNLENIDTTSIEE